mgnify:CR=1 FL=1
MHQEAESRPGAGGGPLPRDVLWAIIGVLYLAPLGLLLVGVAWRVLRRRGVRA